MKNSKTMNNRANLMLPLLERASWLFRRRTGKRYIHLHFNDIVI